MGVVALFVVSACATANYSTVSRPGAVVELSQSHVMVYSFLDVRERDFGRRMIEEFSRQVTGQLATRGVEATVVEFRDSLAGAATAVSGSTSLPLREIVAENRAREQELSVNYRLLILPSDMTIQGAWQYFDVNWLLIDVQTEEVVWRTTLEGSRLVNWSIDENWQGRATEMVAGALEELSKSGLVSAVALPVAAAQ
ncbi:MAG: hypothetical protein NW206_18410 [Hyphomonadaceae bacterium]|nr:hypothetical protein [Hyphomonadaceae bacterium]